LKLEELPLATPLLCVLDQLHEEVSVQLTQTVVCLKLFANLRNLNWYTLTEMGTLTSYCLELSASLSHLNKLFCKLSYFVLMLVVQELQKPLRKWLHSCQDFFLVVFARLASCSKQNQRLDD